MISRSFIAGLVAAIGFAIAGGFSGEAKALTIDTTSAWQGNDYSIFGGGLTSPTKTYGQTFALLAPGEFESFSFTIRASPSPDYSPLKFDFHVMSWSEQELRPVGDVIFSKTNNVAGLTSFQLFDFDLGRLPLSAGTYVAFVTVLNQAGLIPQSTTTGIAYGSMAGTFADSYTGGKFVLDLYQAQNFAELVSHTWFDFGPIDTSFTARFIGGGESVPAIPEPELVWMLTLGLALVMLRVRCKQF